MKQALHHNRSRTVMVTGHRHMTNRKIIAAAVRSCARALGEPHGWVFGGALGVDTIALEEVTRAGVAAHTIVVLPNTLAHAPVASRAAIEACRPTIIELHMDPSNRASYLRRNDYMLDMSRHVLAFYDGDPRSGTGYTVRRAEQLGLNVIMARLEK